ncbi:GGDEF domain-containing protein [uncultured Pseudacidovorax sp.]|uniref:sensor domain-containing protein n=2 Tax=uncultured Pseudacidovorax sp. TaxID=679313 RepID=UPI0025F12EBA|nr:GGDEF domain-containing protein [uncultured Pseudacidovorax sp.]
MPMRRFVSENFLDLLLDAVCAVTPSGDFVFVNAAFERIFGYGTQEVVGRNMMEFVHPDDRAPTLEAARRVMQGHLQLHFENRYIRKDGGIVHVRWTAQWVESAGLRVAVAHDITELHQSRALQAALYAISEAAHTAQDLFSLFESVHGIVGTLLDARNFAVLLFDDARQLLHPAYQVDVMGRAPGPISPADAPWLARLLGQAPAEEEGDSPPGLLAAALPTQDGPIGALVLRSEDPEKGYGAADAELLHFIASQVATAIERKRLHVGLQTLAQRDQLTQLLNRRSFVERLSAAVRAAQERGSELSLLFLDLDEFKRVNDSMGHAMGDRLLQSVADRLGATVRSADVLARLGGDEFVVLLEQDVGGRGAYLLSSRIEQAFIQPFVVGDANLVVRPSIGAARFPLDGKDAEGLLGHADAAMYAVKRQRAASREPAAPEEGRPDHRTPASAAAGPFYRSAD